MQHQHKNNKSQAYFSKVIDKSTKLILGNEIFTISITNFKKLFSNK